jgi:hypothetical protein
MTETPKVSAVAPRDRGERSIWVIAGGLALFAVIFVVWLFSRPPVPPAAVTPTRPASAVGLTRLDDATTDAMVREQADLFDPRPLFLPTRWNAQPRNLPAEVAREPGASFADFAPKWTFDESMLALSFPTVVATPSQPVEAFAVSTPVRPLLGLGRVDLAMTALTARGGFVEVQAAGTGERVLGQGLVEALPPAVDWAPLEFLVAVNAAGLVGPPQLMRTSGSDAVDAYFRTFLVEKFRLGARLRAGFFRVCIGP